MYLELFDDIYDAACARFEKGDALCRTPTHAVAKELKDCQRNQSFVGRIFGVDVSARHKELKEEMRYRDKMRELGVIYPADD